MSGKATADVLDYASPGRTRVAGPPRPPVQRIVLFGLLLFPLVVLLAYPIAWLLPAGWWTEVITEVPTGLWDMNRQPVPMSFLADGPGRGDSVPMTWVTVQFDRRLLMNVDLRQMTYWPVREVGARNNLFPLTREGVMVELRRTRVALTPDQASGLADTIMAELQDLAAGRLPPPGKTDTSRILMPYRMSQMDGSRWPRGMIWWPWYTPWCVPIWLVAWVLLGKWLLRRHRRRLAAFHERSPS
jgi:hypothetical protein